MKMTQNAQSAGNFRFFAFLFALGAALYAFAAIAQDASEQDAIDDDSGPQTGVILSLNGPVTPTSADYLKREIEAANGVEDDLIVIEIDTPGGLVDSMKTIIKAILASDTPVATYVSPQGARSASAGLYIMYGAHVSAMAPATNTGAATPVEVGGGPSRESPFEGTEPFGGADYEENEEDAGDPNEGAEEGAASSESANEDDALEGDEPIEVAPLSSPDAMRAKVINDSVAYIRALAEERGRNADWAERAVREGVSVTHNEALELGVIDLIADDLDDLLNQINGREVQTAAGPVTIDTSEIQLRRVEPTTLEQVLNFIANPNVAVILMSLATTGIIIEMWNPGSIFPGALGLLCLILGLYSFQVLPFAWLGVALMGVGAILIAVEAFTPAFGLSGLAGLIFLGAGMYTIFPGEFRVSSSVIVTTLVFAGAFLGVVLMAILGSRSRGPLIGEEAIRRREGYVDDWDGKEGHVIVEGERWRARSDKVLQQGDKIRVVEIDGLVLVVRQAKSVSFLGVGPIIKNQTNKNQPSEA